MPLFGLLLLAALVARPALGSEPSDLRLPPPAPRAEPGASARAPLDERRPFELLGHGRAWAPFTTEAGASSDSVALGAGLGVGFRSSPYFSVGGEASALRAGATPEKGRRWVELAAVGRVYLLEAGPLDPFLELGLGYALSHTAGARTSELSHGPSARAGGGVDLVVLAPLRLGVLVGYREVAHFPSGTCSPGCRVEAQGGLLAGFAVTLPLGQPL